jgi:cytochrome P450
LKTSSIATSSSSKAPPFTASLNPAGTDPRHFTPGFDIAAERKPHFGFGGGVHHCLGHFIASADVTEALKALPRRIRNLRYDGEPAWLPPEYRRHQAADRLRGRNPEWARRHLRYPFL